MTRRAIALVVVERMAMKMLSSRKCFGTAGKHTRKFLGRHYMWWTSSRRRAWIPGGPWARESRDGRIHRGGQQNSWLDDCMHRGGGEDEDVELVCCMEVEAARCGGSGDGGDGGC